ncbi:MAG: SDR family NAD(P)-dependent oxidoreductase, partial [Desulfobacteraceae bacterium]|nr:SDR family NAD(P)-dependent oxidoreductase [Desulfobacteraceae bacterium]
MLSDLVHGRAPAEITAVRDGIVYDRTFDRLRLPPTAALPFREKGVYFILGGGGGIGMALSRYLAREVHARLVLVGRRELSNRLKEFLARLHSLGGEAVYIRADAESPESLKEAVADARKRFSRIDGVIHSALVLNDRSLEKMTEEDFRSVLAPKVKGSLLLHQAFKGSQLDFMLFFSSAQSFFSNAGQSNYAAASAFEDAYAAFADREEASCPVHVINWGYWGSVGVVSDEIQRKRQAARGLVSIEPEEGMDAVARVLGHGISPVMPLKAETHLLREMGIDGESWVERHPTAAPALLEGAARRIPKPSLDRKRLERAIQGFHALNQRAGILLLALYQGMDLFRRRNAFYDRTKVRETLGIIPRYDRLLDAMLHILAARGWIRERNGGYETTEELPLPESVSGGDLSGDDLDRNHPDMTAHAALLRTCMAHAPDILSGDAPAADVIFPDASVELVEGVYRNNLVSDHFNTLTAAALGTYVESRRPTLSPGETFHVMEVGAGTGGTSSRLLSVLSANSDRVRYTYTDIAERFVTHGRDRFGRYGFTEFKRLNIEEDIRTQGFSPGSVDVVIAANVLHATRNLRESLQHLKDLLKPNGWLILNETTDVSEFATLTFGFLEGWWRFEDKELRIPESPLLSRRMWLRLLLEEGFRWPLATGLPGSNGFRSAQHVIVSESDGMVRKKVPKPSPEFGRPIPIPPEKAPARLGSRTNGATVKGDPDPENAKAVVEDKVKYAFLQTMGVDEADFSDEKPFSEYGVDSILAVKLINRVNDSLGILLKTTAIFDHPHLQALCEYIYSAHREQFDGRISGESEKRPSEQPVPPPSQASDAPPSLPPSGAAAELPAPSGGRVRAAVVAGPGGIRDLEIRSVPSRDPAGTEVQIQVQAFSLNFGDWLCVQGLYPTMPPYPFTPGFEVAGIVLKTGPDAKRFRPGDSVIALTGTAMGGHAEQVTLDEMQLVKKPESISFETACAFPVVFLTAHHVFELARVQQGEKILIQTAAGGVGLIAVQMARRCGAEIFATAGSREKLDHLKEMGVPHLINYRETDFARRLMALTGGYGADVVINTLSGDAIQKGIDCLAPGGRYVEIAMTGMKSAGRFDLRKMTDNQAFFSVDLRKLYLRQPDRMSRDLLAMAETLEADAIRPTVGKVFPFSRIADAYAYLRDRKNIGKVVVTHPEQPAAEAADAIETVRRAPGAGSMDIAVVGVAGRFPKAPDARSFWDNIAASRCAVTEVPGDRWSMAAHYDPDPDNRKTTHCPWGGFLDSIDRFDPLFFNLSGKEAEMMDPQQRLFLEVCWAALEDAGYAQTSVSEKRCGVYVGVGRGDYQFLMDQAGVDPEAHAFWGNADSILAARISYFLNLKGPSMAVDTACSSSLVAIHLACQSLLSGECDMALAGGVFACTTPRFHILASNSGMLSASGRCRAFDDAADGFVPGEGAGAVVLKPLAAAKAEGDPIYGVILGCGINQDGKTMDITAPSSRSQTELEVSVYRRFGIHPDTLTYVEAHGTGTRLGDPIEVDALTQAFRRFTNKTQYCALGSVKTNIGHTGSAAGIASVIKVLYALKNKAIPPSLHFETANRHIDFAASPFYVNTRLRPWMPPSGVRRRAAVSSFGFSGTNAHLVFEEFDEAARGTEGIEQGAGDPTKEPAADPESRVRSPVSGSDPQIIVLSAKTEDRLKAYAASLLAFIEIPEGSGNSETESPVPEEAVATVSERVGELLAVDASDLDPDESFESLGLDPVQISALAARINERHGLALSPSHLREYPSIRRLAEWIGEMQEDRRSGPAPVIESRRAALQDIAYTLQVGRQPMEWRLAAVASDLRELKEKLERFLAGDRAVPRLFSGRIPKGPNNRDFDAAAGAAHDLAAQWVAGADIDWKGGARGKAFRRRISLPTYPFARERYWVNDGGRHPDKKWNAEEDPP